jgi:electron transfer flavoprotein alpha subunit
MKEKILAVLEQREGLLKKVSYEVASLVNKLSADLSCEAESLVIGDEISNLQELSDYSNNKIIHFKNSALNNYSSSAYSKIISDYVIENQFTIIILPNTSMGIDLAPRIAVKTNSGIGTDCIKVSLTEGNIVFTKPFMQENH